jgi:hypothetical protein
MRKEDILAYMQRDWAAIAASKRERWSEIRKTMTAEQLLAMGDDLRNYAFTLHPDWPTERHRREDFDVHVRVSESLRRVERRGR